MVNTKIEGRIAQSSSSPEALRSHDSPDLKLPGSKRQRLSDLLPAKSSDFSPGALVSIRMQNFMTYDDISYDFGPALNMIIGPNGSGKSTVVAGICLGLGFDPRIMGRADKVEATIKHGTQTATIEIDLQGHRIGSNVKIMRQFGHGQNGAKGQNDWRINGKKSTHKAVQELVRGFNCQIDNLCQFLPQDKVASFARMKPIEMLAATLRTIGDGSLGETQTELIDLQEKHNTESMQKKIDEDKLKGLKARQEILERDVARFKERQSLQLEMHLRTKRLPFAKYTEAKAAHEEAKARYKEAKNELLRIRSGNQPLEEQENDLNDTQSQKQRQVSRINQRFEAAVKILNSKSRLLKTAEDEMSSLENKYKQERDAEKNNKSRIRELRERVARESRTMGDEPNVDDEIADLVQQIKTLNASDREERNEREELESYLRSQKSERSRREEEMKSREKELDSLDDIRGIRLRMLRAKNPDAADAVAWLQENHDKFDHRVYDPVLLEVQVTNKVYAKAAQHVIMQNAFTFTCQSRKDYQTFNALLVDGRAAGRRLRLNVVEWSKTAAPHLRDQRTQIPSDEVKALGLDGGYLLDCLDGPDAVLNTLCHTAHVHNLPIGNRELSQAQIQTIENTSKNEKPVFQRYILNNTDTRIFRGYNQVSSESQAVHNDGAIFSHVIDISRKKQLENEVEEIRNSINSSVETQQKMKDRWEKLKATLADIEEEKKVISRKRTELQSRKTIWRSGKAKFEQSQKELERLESAPAEYQDNMASIRATQLERTKYFTQLAIEYKDEIRTAQDLHEKLVVATCAYLQAVANKEAFDVHNKAIQAELSSAEQAMQAGKEAKDKTLRYAQEIHRQANLAVADLTEEEKNMISDFDTETTVETLEIEIEDYRNRLSFLAATDGNVVDHYEARAREIESLESTVANKDQVLQELKDDIDSRRSEFESRLEEMRSKIDKSFGEAFRSIDCLGEIRIGKPEDFAAWTLEIWVQFRDTDSLQMLTGERQSGGERSVSTIFYLMALQSLSIAPFRVVDEINQGMDPRNERRVHARMVDVACEITTSQYFLITPKLLPQLQYHPNMKVHCVTSGNLGRSGNKIGYASYLAALRARKLQSQQSQTALSAVA
ncbi:protein of unknown function [Taphrina deformans PYCC 5710]|uniref:Structural maintenance of chromosomes protein 5 n=1 Tax=Taphrina deformans (strain PYCC 5710 / ATCC 11124 / CBS 356.35 / IMI 108563 / JCM 9778 / NBRC 8474) TaxID=1097556 RepID=R4XEP5_TAPDE|nr:protein of unknown function [Taphrina deformans PYCC 5710]|eukprot:CCG84322.1 protein of unknown function [Taphrina deformans PYCC 5710]